jgi:hypothetical protein
MAEEKTPKKKSYGQPKTLEMRVAALEDKLAKVHITEEELQAFHKVSALLGAHPAAMAQCAYCEWASRRWGIGFPPAQGLPGGPTSGDFGKLGD